jgi:hypothetical protein
MNTSTTRKAHGVSKEDGISTLAAVLNAADEWIVLDHTEIEGAWIAQARLGLVVITGTNVDLTIDAFDTAEVAAETLHRSADTAVGAGLFVKDRGTYEPGQARPEDIAEVTEAIEAAKAKMAMVMALRERLSAGGGLGSLSELFGGQGGSQAPALPVAAASSDDDWRPGMYV